jgi:raffinose/stachyose/melibiose transport system substrate-binding protein
MHLRRKRSARPLRTRPALRLIHLTALVVAGACTSGLVLTACGGSSSQSTTSSTVASKGSSVVLHIEADPGWTWMQAAAKDFEHQHPGVKVDLEAIPGQAYYQDIVQRLSVANPPDITVLELGPGPYSTLVSNHLLTNLDPIWTKLDLAKAYYPVVATDYTSAGNQHYAVSPDFWWGPVVYYNTAVLKRAGVTPPTSPIISEATFTSMMSRLSKAGVLPMAVDGEDQDIGFGYILSSLVESACGNAAYANLEYNWAPSVPLTTKWTSPCAEEALSTLESWNKAGYFGTDATSRGYTEAQGLFVAGKAGTRMDASWFPNELGPLDDKFTGQYGWFLIPSVPGGSQPEFQVQNQDAMGISAKSPYQKLDAEFLELTQSKGFESTSEYWNWIAGVPGRADVTPAPSRPAVLLSMREAFSRIGMVTSLPWAAPYGTFQGGPLQQQVTALLSGTQSVAATAAGLQSAVVSQRKDG